MLFLNACGNVIETGLEDELLPVTFSALAEDDLARIGDYIAEDNPVAAQEFVERLANRCLSLAEDPRLGRKRDDIRPGVRGLNEGSYLILYRVKATEVEIIRVWHTKRDIRRLIE